MNLIPSYELTTPPAVEPVDIDTDVKPHLRLTGAAAHDALLVRLAKEARQWLERKLDRVFITQTWKAYMDCWPKDRVIRLSRLPVQSITSITYLDSDHATQTLATSQYDADTKSEPARIVPAPEVLWPSLSTKPNAVTITFTAGYGSAATDVPEPLIGAILEIVAHRFRNPGDERAFPWEDLPLVSDVLYSYWSGDL